MATKTETAVKCVIDRKTSWLDTPFEWNGAAAVIAHAPDGRVYLFPARITSYDFLDEVAKALTAEGVMLSEMVEVVAEAYHAHDALISLDGTIYRAGGMPRQTTPVADIYAIARGSATSRPAKPNIITTELPRDERNRRRGFKL